MKKVFCSIRFILLCFFLAILTSVGPVSSIMVNQFGCRPVMLVGGLLASSGMILASFTTNIIELYLTAGVLTGQCLKSGKGNLGVSTPSEGTDGM